MQPSPIGLLFPHSDARGHSWTVTYLGRLSLLWACSVECMGVTIVCSSFHFPHSAACGRQYVLCSDLITANCSGYGVAQSALLHRFFFSLCSLFLCLRYTLSMSTLRHSLYGKDMG